MTSELSASVPAFLAKLWKMVEDPKTNNLISWSLTGKSFFIRNQSKFTSELLPFYYKHNNMASFIRQLNMYGFHKKVSVELGGLKCDKDEIEFAHQYFCKDQPFLLDQIKRKVSSTKNQDPSLTSIKPELVNKMLTEVKNMKCRQDNMDTTLNEMKQENTTLWRELVSLRRKHMKQQQIINKLIQFLVTLVQPSRSGISVKRQYPLMINDSNRSHKPNKLSKLQESSPGPVIHELDASELMDSDYITAAMLENETPNVQSPQEHIETPTDDENMETVQLNKDPGQNFKIETKKKRVSKGKKKRKNKVPMKIEISSLENGKKSRERLHMLEISTDEDEPLILQRNDTIGCKSVPMATVRSSKLTAMAANIKSQNIDNDIDTQAELEDNMEVLDNDASMVKLENILTVPDMLNDNIQNSIENKKEDNSNLNKINRLNQLNDGRSILLTSSNEQHNENRMVKSLQKENNSYDRASPCSSQDLLVSRVNSGINEPNYRLEPTEDIDNHLETMQNDLDSLREMFRNENYSLNANTILELFDDDPMSYALPMNPELNPNSGKEDDNIISDSIHGSAGGELMTYNPSPNLLDFDDDILLGNSSSSLPNPSDLHMNSFYTSDPLELEDTKISLLDTLVANNMNTKS